MTQRLMIVADDALSASTLRHAFRATGAFTVIDGYAEGRGPCGAVAAAHHPDLVVIDQLCSCDDMLARVVEIRTALPAVKLILLRTQMNSAWLTAATAAGADAAIAKTVRLEGLGLLVREVAAGHVFHAFEAPRPALRPVPDPDLPSLTNRELEVLRLVAAGAPNSRIAAQLWITEQTVKFHLSKVYRKLGVANRTEASHCAYVNGLFDPTPETRVAA
jgi:DNA-binding NarL/FixJ family response regulator